MKKETRSYNVKKSLQQTMLGKLDRYMQKNETGNSEQTKSFLHHTQEYTQNGLKT